MKNKIILITGATSGIGKVAALELAKLGNQLILVARNREKGVKVVEEIKSQTGNSNIELMICDFSSLQSIRDLADNFLKKHNKLDILINNAGVIVSKYEETIDGYERTFAVNHLGYFLLTNLLLGALKAGDSARIINTASRAHINGKIHFDDINCKKNYSDWKAYSQSKLANILFTRELARRLQGSGITANCLHPGVVITNWMYGSSPILKLVFKIYKLFMITAEKGAETIIYLATSKEVENISGEYFAFNRIKKSSKLSYDMDVAKKLWELSDKMCGIYF